MLLVFHGQPLDTEAALEHFPCRLGEPKDFSSYLAARVHFHGVVDDFTGECLDIAVDYGIPRSPVGQLIAARREPG